MLYLLFAIACIILAWQRLLPFFGSSRPSSSKRYPQDDEDGTDIVGDPWEQLSIFQHIEQGLNRNPDAPAVICTFQPQDHLGDLMHAKANITTPPKAQEQTFESALWQGHRAPVADPDVSRGQQQRPTTPKCATLTYAELHQISLKLAAGLQAYGARPESTLFMLIPNGVEYPVLLWTCALLRITYVSLDPSMLDISGFTALKHTLRDVKPQIVVAPDATSGKAIDVAVSELGLPQPIRLCLASSMSRGSNPAWKPLASMSEYASRFETPDDRDSAQMMAAARQDRPDRIHSIMFTSGTSGRPKGCPLRVSGMSHVLQSQRWLLTPESAALALQQPHNSRGIAPAQTLQTWAAGGAVVMTGQAFSVRDAADAIRQLGVTFLVLTPPMVHEMAAELAERPLPPDATGASSVRTIQVGGDAVTRDVLINCARLFPRARVCVNHGMTEGGGSFVWPFFETPPRDIPYFGGDVPRGPVGARVADSGVGRRGGTGLIRGYMGGRSAESFYQDRRGRSWFITGDVVTVDAAGLVYILGRGGDMIRRAGVIVMPAVIESSIESFLGVQTVVVPVPHHVLGAEPFAVVSSYGDGRTEGQIKEHVRAALGRDYALAGLASLKQLGLVEFPLNQTHKVVRSELRGLVLKHLDRQKSIANVKAGDM
ncbi:4-coumarate--CoA ligase 2 [Apiospora aurea]|uniref:4-coumarate--CoA ligase 2 n=1 Tax=Apiospora aurea TaxID=335848 RepID=A0ABR1PSQ1_9PEZI